ncbi:MAG: PH domain-containing protein [Oscillospiraceae bacterium]|nr:PH domain-containing protein [Oscillospiraceae bacterium]
MIDFNNASFVKLRPVNDNAFEKMVAPILVSGEEIANCFQSIRDGVVFTNNRIITINIQGITGKKKDFTSLPFSKIQAFSVETAGAFDLDSELELWFSGMGRIKLEFIGATDVAYLCKMISEKVL